MPRLRAVKFKPQAAYEDGRASELTGAAAYALYDEANRELIAECGGCVLFSGDANTLVIGPGMQPEFDRAVLFEFPSMEAYNDVAGKSVELQSKTGVSSRPKTLLQCRRACRASETPLVSPHACVSWCSAVPGASVRRHRPPAADPLQRHKLNVGAQ